MHDVNIKQAGPARFVRPAGSTVQRQPIRRAASPDLRKLVSIAHRNTMSPSGPTKSRDLCHSLMSIFVGFAFSTIQCGMTGKPAPYYWHAILPRLPDHAICSSHRASHQRADFVRALQQWIPVFRLAPHTVRGLISKTCATCRIRPA